LATNFYEFASHQVLGHSGPRWRWYTLLEAQSFIPQDSCAVLVAFSAFLLSEDGVVRIVSTSLVAVLRIIDDIAFPVDRFTA
jgi:hypothetical protein